MYGTWHVGHMTLSKHYRLMTGENMATKYKKRISKWTIARLVASGALLGVAVAGVLGIDTSGLMNTIFGVSGAAVAAVALKAVHVI